MRVVFFGSGAFGLPTLAWLASGRSGHEIVGVVTQPDRPAGRSRRPTPTPVGAWAAEHLAVPVRKPEAVNEARVCAEIRGWPAEAWVVIAFGQKLGQRLLADRFAVNLHGSLLPRWRGAAPIHHAVLAGDETTGVSVITLADRMDAGDVLGTRSLPIDPEQTVGELHDALALLGPEVVGEVLERRVAGTLEHTAQDPANVTHAGKLDKARDGWVDFAQDAAACQRRVHGLTPWPGVSVGIGGERVKLLRVAVVGGETGGAGEPGTLADAGAGIVWCGGGTRLALREVQPSGGRAMGWGSFAAGRPLTIGTRLEGAPRC